MALVAAVEGQLEMLQVTYAHGHVSRMEITKRGTGPIL